MFLAMTDTAKSGKNVERKRESPAPYTEVIFGLNQKFNSD